MSETIVAAIKKRDPNEAIALLSLKVAELTTALGAANNRIAKLSEALASLSDELLEDLKIDRAALES